MQRVIERIVLKILRLQHIDGGACIAYTIRRVKKNHEENHDDNNIKTFFFV